MSLFRNVLTVLFLLWLAEFAQFSVSHASNSESGTYLKETTGENARLIKTLATCQTYFELAHNSFRRDARLRSRDFLGAMRALKTAVNSALENSIISKEEYRALKEDIEDVLYLQIDRETRKIGILVDEYDVKCQFLANSIMKAIKKYYKER